MSTNNTCASTDPLLTPRRVVLRFATASAPEKDEDVYRPFLAQEKVDHQDYYVHIQPRDYDRTHIVIDFCESSSLSIDRIPHQLYRVTWKDGIPYVLVSNHIDGYGQLN
jgi:3-deoxy-D-manno-octulosonic-acid transferase